MTQKSNFTTSHSIFVIDVIFLMHLEIFRTFIDYVEIVSTDIDKHFK